MIELRNVKKKFANRVAEQMPDRRQRAAMRDLPGNLRVRRVLTDVGANDDGLGA